MWGIIRRIIGAILFGAGLALVLAYGLDLPDRLDEASGVVSFTRGTQMANGAEDIIRVAATEQHGITDTVIVLEGHSGVSGDPIANMRLSADRVEVVYQRLLTLGVVPEDIILVPLGPTDPLPRRENETTRAYDSRLARVSLRLIYD